MRIVWKEDGESAWLDGQPRGRTIVEKDDVFLYVEVARRLLAFRSRPPADFLVPLEGELDIDVGAMRFEALPTNWILSLEITLRHVDGGHRFTHL